MNLFLEVLLVPIFLLVCYICFATPGRFLLKKLNLFEDELLVREAVGVALGLCIFVLLTYLLSMIGLRDAIWLLIAISGIGFIFRLDRGRDGFGKVFRSIRSKTVVFWVVLIIGVIGQVAVNAPSGMRYEKGIYFWSSHGHDGVWHLALMEEFNRKEWPFMNPELAGERLVNYHFFSDLVMSEIGRLFRFDNLDIYFRLMPVFNSLMLGLSAYLLVRKLSGKEIGGIWAMFFVYFAGSFGYLVTIPRNGNIVGESVFWVSQTQSVLGNPPHAMAFYILMVYLLCLIYWFKKSSWKLGLVLLMLGASLIEFKVYAGLLVLGGLLVSGVFELIFSRKLPTLILFFVTTTLALGLYIPNSTNSEGFLVWQPWWFIRTMVVAPDRLNLLDWELRRQTYIAESNWKRVVWLEGVVFLIFLFGNLGMRFIGFWTFFKLIKNKIYRNYMSLFLVSITIAAFWIPVFFLQKGVAWNAIQFNQYFLLLFGLFAAWTCNDISGYIKNKGVKWILTLTMIILAVPTQIGLLWQFYANKPLSNVSYKQMEIFDYMKQNTDPESVILTKPFDIYERDKFTSPPIPIYAWYGTGYVSAFSGRRTLLADSEQVQIMGYSVDNLIKEQRKIFETKDPDEVNYFLLDRGVDYVYLSNEENFVAPINKLKLALVAGNSDARLYKVVQ